MDSLYGLCKCSSAHPLSVHVSLHAFFPLCACTGVLFHGHFPDLSQLHLSTLDVTFFTPKETPYLLAFLKDAFILSKVVT